MQGELNNEGRLCLMGNEFLLKEDMRSALVSWRKAQAAGEWSSPNRRKLPVGWLKHYHDGYCEGAFIYLVYNDADHALPKFVIFLCWIVVWIFSFMTSRVAY